MSNAPTTFFAPYLITRVERPAMDFYQKAFDARVLRRVDNEDGSVHIAEMEIGGALFHVHERSPRDRQLNPEQKNAGHILIGLFTPDPDRFFSQATQAGAKAINAMQDFDYGYRQGIIADPFGYQWMLQKKIE